MRRGCSALAVVALAACTRERAAVELICHNGNCVAPASLDDDSTLPALRASLALRVDGEVPFDGMEIDLSWDAATDRCVFAHDLDAPGPYPAALDAATELASHLGADRVSWNGERLTLLLEVKRGVDADATRHTPAQRAAHAACALDFVEALRAPAADAGITLNVLIESFEPDLLDAIAADPRWDGPVLDGPLQLRRCATFSIPAPLGYTHPLSDFGDLEVVDVHSRLTSPSDWSLYASMGLEVALWFADPSADVLQAIDRFRPEYAVTGDVELVHRWLD
jgi:hypothetical protein